MDQLEVILPATFVDSCVVGGSVSQFVVGSVTLHFHDFLGYGNPVNIHERKEPGTQFLCLRGSCVDLKKHGISNTHSPTSLLRFITIRKTKLPI